MRRLILFIGVYMSVLTVVWSRSGMDSLLTVLDHTIDQNVVLEQKKLNKIQSIKELLNDQNLSFPERHQIMGRLIQEYSSYNYDSTLLYVIKSLAISEQLDDQELIQESLLLEAELLSRTGDYKESLDILNTIDRTVLDKSQFISYYSSYAKVYENLSYYTAIDEIRKGYQLLQKKYTDSLVQRINPNSDQYLSILEKKYRDARQLDQARAINDKRLSKVEMGTPMYSLITFHRSLICEMEGNAAFRKKYLTLSAISDILSVNKDNASLTKLALILFDEKDIDRAYQYIQFSFSDAKIFNSKLRYIEIAHIFPTITSAYQSSVDQKNDKLRSLLFIISFLSLGLIVMVFSIFRQNNKLKHTRNALRQTNDQLRELNVDLSDANGQLKALNSRLIESDHVKETYIANFLNICSDFIEKLDNYRLMVKRMVVARKFEELVQRTNSSELIDAEVEAFYKTFDTTFLHIYPDFVVEFNNLLEEGSKIELKSGELLNTELRIFALIRLGIVDSSDISRLLRYSVNTIYNYRAKIKNQSAVPRDDFEAYVMKIDAFLKPEE